MDHLDIVKRLCDNNCDTYIVGGGIRDMLLGNNPDDYDVVTKATPEQVISLFQDDCVVKKVGKSFGVILVDGFEVATFREDIYKDEKCSVRFAETIHEDLSRRDLTINAMAYCELTGELIDNHGGKKDLEERIIRFVGNPDDRILEDPIRILRACRFLAKIDGVFAPSTFEALKKHSEYLFNYKIAPERIRIEILKAMKIQKASRFFEALHSIGALKYIFPLMDDCWKHPHGNHHTEDVFEHCMMAGDSIWTKDPILKLTGYLHDVGKPSSYCDERLTFINHEKIGSEILHFHLKELTFGTLEIRRICGLIRSHMNSIKEMTPKAIRRLLKKFDDRGVEIVDFMRLRMADRKANIARTNFTLTEWKIMYNKLINGIEEELPFNAHSLVYTGGDIIKDFELKPGKIIGDIQDHLLEQVLENGSEFNDKNILKELTNSYISMTLGVLQ